MRRAWLCPAALASLVLAPGPHQRAYALQEAGAHRGGPAGHDQPAPEAAISPFWGPSAVAVSPIVLRLELIGRDTPRPMQVLVFQPAANGTTRWTLGQLVEATCVPEGQPVPPTTPQACAAKLLADLSEYRPDRPVGKAVLDLPLQSLRDGAPAGGSRPLILLDGGLRSDALSYFALAEWIASHGFVVVSAPSLPFAADRPLTFDAAGVRSKTDDLRRVLDVAAGWPGVDPEGVVVAAWSVGGVSAGLLAAEDRRVAGVLSLDGGLGYAYGPGLMTVSRAPSGSPPEVALLHVTGTRPNPYDVPKDFSVLPRLASRAWLVELDGINHSHFVMQGGVVPFAGESSGDADLFWRAHAALGRVAVAFARWATARNGSDLETAVRDALGSAGRVRRLLPDAFDVAHP